MTIAALIVSRTPFMDRVKRSNNALERLVLDFLVVVKEGRLDFLLRDLAKLTSVTRGSGFELVISHWSERNDTNTEVGTYDSKLSNESSEGDRLVSLPLLVLVVSMSRVISRTAIRTNQHWHAPTLNPDSPRQRRQWRQCTRRRAR